MDARIAELRGLLEQGLEARRLFFGQQTPDFAFGGLSLLNQAISLSS